MKILTFITSLFAWMGIVASPLIVGIVTGILVSKKFPTKIGLYAGIAITIMGLIIGVILATKIWKKQGTVEFISRISATPELDD